MPDPAFLIFVPGIMGTELWDVGATMVWGGQLDAIIDTLCNHPRALYSASVRPGEVIDSITSQGYKDLPVYLGLLGKIHELGYNSRNFVAFGYDWRRSNAVSAARLAEFMHGKIAQGTERFIILAHSMGGLVTRLMLQDASLAARVERYIQIATPVRGSSKAYATLKRGPEIHGLFDFYRKLLNRLSPLKLHDLLDSLAECPSMFELLPPPGTNILENPNRLWADAFNRHVWPPSLVDRLKETESLHSLFQAVPGCPHTTIFSTGVLSTPHSYNVDIHFNIVSDHPGTNGDGTVTWDSAKFGSDPGTHIEIQDPNSHDKLPNSADVLAIMVKRGWLQTASRTTDESGTPHPA